MSLMRRSHFTQAAAKRYSLQPYQPPLNTLNGDFSLKKLRVFFAFFQSKYVNIVKDLTILLVHIRNCQQKTRVYSQCLQNLEF